MAIESDDPTWLNFRNSIKSPYTADLYSRVLDMFKKHCAVERYTDLLYGEDRKTIEAKITDWIMERRKAEVKGNTIRTYLAVLTHFYTINDITTINWKKVKKFLPDTTRPDDDRPHTIEEIRKLLNVADVRMKVAILLMCSAGLRLGGLVALKVRDLERVNNIYKIRVYADSKKDRYETFCTPECALAIDDYLTYRKNAGETIQPDAPVIREQIAIPSQPRHVSEAVVADMMTRMSRRAGIRTKGEKYERKETKLNHGLRKYFRQTLRRAGISEVIAEYLMGHHIPDPESGITKLSMVYDPAQTNEMATLYSKAIDYLSISTENKLRIENQALREELAVSGDAKKMLEEMKQLREEIRQKHSSLEKPSS